MISPIHKAYILFMRSLSVAAPGLKVTCVGGDAAVEMEEIVRDTCRRQWFIFGHLVNPYDDGEDSGVCDVRWFWFEDEAMIMRGEKLAPKNKTVINAECEYV